MGQALLRGIHAGGVIPGTHITACDRFRHHLDAILEETGATFTTEPAEASAAAPTILLAVKPRDLPLLLSNVPAEHLEEKLIISIAAGIPLAALRSWCPESARVVRAMPNIAALIRQGVAAFTVASNVTEDDVAKVEALFSGTGVVHQLDEDAMDAVTGLSGSGPGFVLAAIEALADGGVRCGLPRRAALDLAARTVAGTAQLLLETGDHPAQLRDAVCSPGGTTIEGLAILEGAGFRAALIEAVTAATERSRDIKVPAPWGHARPAVT